MGKGRRATWRGSGRRGSGAMGKGRRATGPRAAATALVALALAGAAAGQAMAGRPGALCAEAEGVARGGSAQARRDYEALCGTGAQPQASEEGGPRGRGRARGRGLHQAAAGARPAVSNLRRADGSSEVRLTAYGADGAAAEFKVGPGGAEYGGQTLDERFQGLEAKNGELEGNVTVLKQELDERFQALATVYSVEFRNLSLPILRNATTSYLVQLDFPFLSRAPPLPTQFTATSSNESLVQVEFLPGEGPARTLRLVPKAWESYGLSSYNFAAEISLSASTAYSSASAAAQATIASHAGTLGWSAKANMPTARYLMAAGAIDGKIYVVGGSTSYSSRTNKLEVYDPATDTWTTKTNMPTERHQLAAGAIDGKLYVVGGSTYDSPHRLISHVAKLEVYDPATDTWSTKANMLTSREGLAAAAIDGKLYVVGGYNGSYTTTPPVRDFEPALEVYDPATNTWSTKANIPTPRANPAAVAIDGKLYVVGGRSVDGYATGLDVLEVYDPVTDTWSTKANMPTGRHGLAAVPIFGLLYAVGGRNSQGLSKKLEVYDPVTDDWSTLDDMSTARKWLAAAAIDGKIYAAGGELSADDTEPDGGAWKQPVNVLEMTL